MLLKLAEKNCRFIRLAMASATFARRGNANVERQGREGHDVTSGRVNLTGVLLRALKNATSPRKGDWGHAIRVLLLLVGASYGWFGLYHGKASRDDFRTAYPAYEQLETATGMLIEERTRKTSYLLLEVTDKPATPKVVRSRLVTDKPVLPIITNYTLTNILDDMGWATRGDPITPHFVSIKYFRLPSNWVWVAELEYNGKILLDYERRKSDFYISREIRSNSDRRSLIALLLAVAATIWIIFEAYVQMKRENRDGNE